MAIWQWSKTASTNAGADPTINLAEGQAPSTLNDSMRNALAQLAAWRDDTNGSLLTGGTGAAYTIITNQSAQGTGQGIPATPPAGTRVSARAHAANTVSSATTPSLRVDGGTIFPIVTATGTPPAVGAMLLGAVYDFSFNATTSAWIVSGVAAAAAAPAVAVPIGGTIIWWTDTLPTGWLWCNGQSTSGFPLLAAIVGATTPDLREVVPFGKVGMGGTGSRGQISGIANSAVLKGLFGEQNHTLLSTEIPAHSHPITDLSHSHKVPINFTLNIGAATTGAAGEIPVASSTTFTDSVATGITGTQSNAGGGGAHNTLQPSYTCNWIIRAA